MPRLACGLDRCTAKLTGAQREAAGAGADVIRLSVGLERVEDLIRDLDQALTSS